MHRRETVEALEQDAITGRLDQFKKAVARVKAGEWAIEDLAEFLENISALLATLAQNYIELVEETGYNDWAPAEVELATAGMEDYEVGMSQIWTYIEDGDEIHLDQGVNTIRTGNNKIIAAMRMNREFRNQLAEKLEFFL
ncbi:MAG: hypothetical protein HY319_20025 [Armatimonadetes bacterium]|nr:hypothetical protein [Armatimonadota bacterium]